MMIDCNSNRIDEGIDTVAVHVENIYSIIFTLKF